MEWLQFGLLLFAVGGMGSFGYWKARRDVLKLINELKGDLPTALGLLGKSMFKSVKASEAGMVSGDTRLDKGLSERMLNDFLGSQSPWASMLLQYGKESIPYIKEHPELIMQLAPLVKQFFGDGGSSRQGLSKNETFLGLKK